MNISIDSTYEYRLRFIMVDFMELQPPVHGVLINMGLRLSLWYCTRPILSGGITLLTSSGLSTCSITFLTQDLCYACKHIWNIIQMAVTWVWSWSYCSDEYCGDRPNYYFMKLYMVSVNCWTRAQTRIPLTNEYYPLFQGFPEIVHTSYTRSTFAKSLRLSLWTYAVRRLTTRNSSNGLLIPQALGVLSLTSSSLCPGLQGSWH